MTAIQKYNSNEIINVEYFSDTTIDEFIASRKASENTNRTYRNSIRQLMKFFAAKKITAPTTADLDAFINQLREAKKSPSTLRLYNTCTKLFFSWLERRGLYKNIAADAEPLRLRKATMHAKKSLTTAQAKNLLSAVKGDSLIARRDRAIVALALQTGLRTCEISRLNYCNLRDDGVGGFFAAVTGKGHLTADAEVRIAPAVADMIRSYLELRGVVGADEPLFTSTSRNVAWTKPTKKRKANSYGNRLSEQSVGKLIKRYMKASGIKDKKITAHSTRHFAATTAIKAGVDIREVSAMLRHTSINVTVVYLHDMSVETRRAELAVADSLFSAA